MKKWQYLSVYSWRNDPAMMEELGDRGSRGWELATVIPSHEGLCWIFKRPYEEGAILGEGDTVRFDQQDDGQTRRMDKRE